MKKLLKRLFKGGDVMQEKEVTIHDRFGDSPKDNPFKNWGEKMVKRIVFLKLVDGTSSDIAELNKILLATSKQSNFNFIVSPTNAEIKSLDIEDLKRMIKEVEDDNK